jgi:hypothetical protein
MSRRLRTVLAVEAAAIAALLTLALDMRAHASVQDLGGLNVWGYRGSVAHQRQPNESRIAIVGGSRAFGWGQPAGALSSNIRRIVMFTTDRPGRPLRPVVVINLGRPDALPDDYPATLAHYGYLRPDYVCLYDDLGVRDERFEANASGVFALTGYSPALPLVLREKGMRWRFGTVGRGYEATPAEPRSVGVRQAGGVAVQAVGALLFGLDRAAGRAIDGRTPAGNEAPQAYVAQMTAALAAAHAQARGVVMVLSPADSEAQAARRRALLASLGNGAPWLRVVDLERRPELREPAMRLDGWNYSSAAVELTAELIAPALLDVMDVQ